MFKRLLLLILGLSLAIPVLAQDDATTPQAAINAALTAVEAQVGTRATNFTYEFLGDTSNSALNCPLFAGEELPYTINALLVTVIYPDGQQFTVHTSISGQRVILCDAQFGDAVLANQVNPADACTATPLAALPAYAAPNITVDGVFSAGVEPYPVVGVSSDGGWYQIVSPIGLGWVEATSTTVAGNCDTVPTSSVTNPVAEIICFVSAQGGFSNVRSIPEGDLVGRIYENEVYQITSRNTAGTWFYIQPAGWVSNTVIFQLGDCNAIPVNDNAVGVGFVTDDGVIDTDAAVILEGFACPADFAGYMIPRISIGNGTAQVQQGTVPNTLRAFPSVDDTEGTRLGTIQPNRVIDRVMAGPACNQGFVWWLVEIDGAVGWTAESNQSSNDYFLAPTGDAPVLAQGAVDAIAVGTNPVIGVRYSADGTRLFARTTESGFGDGEVGAVIVYDALNGTSQARIEEPSGIAAIDTASEANILAVAANTGTVTLYDMDSLAPIVQLPNSFDIADQAKMEITPDGTILVIAQCLDDTCTTSRISSLDIASETVLAMDDLDLPIIDLDISGNGTTLAVLTTEGISFHSPDTLLSDSTWVNSDEFAINSVTLNDAGDSALFAGCNNAACTEGRIGLINVTAASLLGIVPSHDTSARGIIYNPDATRFITIAFDSNEIIERNAATGTETQRFTPADVIVTSVTYAPDGNTLTITTADGQILFLALDN